ncbi:MAG TPA: hypothetical protein VFT39_12360 [Vicinamibacterales bacterium]|nr:hypothetical protein [Vicinamibacterales bacterium]
MAHKMWVAKYNRDPSVVGRTFVLNGVPTTLVGIMPQRFTKLAADLWRPIVLTLADPEVSQRYFMFQAKLKPGVSCSRPRRTPTSSLTVWPGSIHPTIRRSSPPLR